MATAASKSAPVDYVALGLLVVATSTIGPKRRVVPWDGWSEPSIIWGALVGPPGSNKSPAIDPLLAAVQAIERSLNLDWPDRQSRYQTAKQSAETLRTIWEQQVRDALKTDLTPPQMPAGAIDPKPPTKDTIWVGNITSEQMARKLAENHGLISFRDELSGLLGGFDKYGGAGGDRSFWLECYGGRPYRYDRVSLKEPLDIAFCAVSLLGGIQPDRLELDVDVGRRRRARSPRHLRLARRCAAEAAHRPRRRLEARLSAIPPLGHDLPSPGGRNACPRLRTVGTRRGR